jgi:iron complex outermembrane receptor protein
VHNLLFRAFLLAGVAALPAFAQSAPATGDVAMEDAEAITVFGRGETRQVAEVGQEQIRLQAPGSSPFKAIERLPGVNFQSADPFGAYEWSTRITLRGFNQNQLGFTLDGLPLGDMSYGNTNGLHISRATISDNIAVTRVSQGAGALATASTSNLGGTIEFISREPSEELNIAANGTYGSEDTVRLFGAIDSGSFGVFRGSISYAYLNAGKWKGDGEQRQHQVNARLVADISDRTRVTAFVNYSDRRENDYQDLSLEMIERLGYDWDNFAPDWATAVRVAQIAQNRGDVGGPPSNPGAGTVYPAPIQSVDDAYYDAAGLRTDWLAGVRLEADLIENVKISIHPYYHNNHGQGVWFTPYVATPGGAPISVRTTEYDISRYGIVFDGNVELGNHAISLGFWAETNDFTQGRRFYGLDDAAEPSRPSLRYKTDPFFTQWRMKFNTETLQFHVQDRWSLSDAFTLSFGFKGQSVSNASRVDVRTGANPAAGNISSSDWFLPQAGLVWRVGGESEVFANYTENRRAFTSAATTGPFSTTQVGFDAIRDDLKPETSKTFEGGFRFGLGDIRGVLAGYYVDFSNRLLAIPTGAGIVGNPAVLQNVGSVRSIGFELGLAFRIMDDLDLFGSYSYNDSTYRDDVVNAAGVVVADISGKNVVDTPENMLKLDVAYDPESGPFARAGLSYMSKRYFTYTNDKSVGARALVDATVGWRFGGEGFMNGFALQASVTNLFDEDYVSTIGSNGFGNAGDNQTLLAGAPRQWFLTVRKDF